MFQISTQNKIGGICMICKSGDYKNGYIFTESSTDEDFQEILKSYKKVNCIICNNNTKRNFRQSFLAMRPGITINNKVADGVFFINSCT